MPEVARAIHEAFLERGWTDGLPILPPTPAAVREMLSLTERRPDELVATIAPRWGRATVERIAVNAVMAGCRPEYLPALLAAVRAVADPAFGLQAIQGTTDLHAPLLIVNGPRAKALGVQAGANCLGQGFRANATIGRALRLILMNLGGGLPGQIDQSTFGQPGKFTYCVAENEEESPWEPLHVERGFRRDESTVTAFPAEGPHQVSDHASRTPEGLLTTICDSMATLGNATLYRGGELLLVFSPEHVRVLKEAGWTKADVRRYVFLNARVPIGKMKKGGDWGVETWRFLPEGVSPKDDGAEVPVVRREEDLILLVAGGVGRHSLIMPGWGYPTRSVTVRIE